jgi:polysaccharide pyruvyl transferase WcaK-like protein
MLTEIEIKTVSETAGRTIAKLSVNPTQNHVTHYGLHEPGNAGDTTLFATVRNALDPERTVDWCLKPLWDRITPSVIDRLNCESRGIIVGGGGLFLSDTNSNTASGWQWACPTDLLRQIDVPLIVYAVGYNQFRGQDGFPPGFDDNIRALVETSAFVGLRNHGSIRRLSEHLGDSHADQLVYQPCPTTVLSRLHPHVSASPSREGPPVLSLNTAFDRHWLRFQGHAHKALSAIAAALRHAQNQGWSIRLVQHVAPRDGSAVPWLDGAGVKYEEVNLHEEPIDAVLQYYRDVDLAMGMRGHSQMIPFGLETPILSLISHDKLQWFLEDIGHPEWGVEIGDDDLESKLCEKIDAVAENPEGRHQKIQSAQDRLWEITQENRSTIFDLLL